MNDAGAGGAEAAPAYGGFRLGQLQLALPMAALREVVPCSQLLPLPCPAACVIGGIDLRGVVVPVLDLRIALGHQAAAAPMPSVIVMVHGGNVLGLLADGVSGVFTSRSGMPDGISVADGSPSLFSGCVQSEDGSTRSVLSPDAIACWPQVPMVRDPEPGRQAAGAHSAQADAAGAAPGTDSDVPMMLMRCGPVALAIDAMAVHSTLADPRVSASPLGRGHCRGVVACAGAEVPAIDLLALCGLGSLDAQVPCQAFVVRIEAGMVAFLVGRVLDIVPTRPADVIALPAFALQRPFLFAGVLPSALWPGAAGDPEAIAAPPFLLLDSEALRGCDEVVALASTGRPASLEAAGEPAGPPSRSMLTYDLGVETATPLDQVSEILPYRAASANFGPQGSTLGVLVNRGRSIPLLCLGRLTSGRPAVPETPTTSVLVVESGGELLGFVVPGLRAIEPTHWAPELRAFAAQGTPAPDDVAAAARCRQLALVGAGRTERLLPVLDLQRMAQAIRTRAEQPRAMNRDRRQAVSTLVSPDAVAGSRASFAARRFLVVDDFGTMRRIVSGLIRELGAEHVAEAEDGAEALDKLTRGDFDFVISDWNMPKLNGLELLKRVRADERLAALPFLLITAEARKENIVEAVRAGADGYIVKPFTSGVLGEKINNILNRRNLA